MIPPFPAFVLPSLAPAAFHLRLYFRLQKKDSIKYSVVVTSTDYRAWRSEYGVSTRIIEYFVRSTHIGIAASASQCRGSARQAFALVSYPLGLHPRLSPANLASRRSCCRFAASSTFPLRRLCLRPTLSLPCVSPAHLAWCRYRLPTAGCEAARIAYIVRIVLRLLSLPVSPAPTQNGHARCCVLSVQLLCAGLLSTATSMVADPVEAAHVPVLGHGARSGVL